MPTWMRLVLNNILVIIPGAIAGALQIDGAFELLQQKWPGICSLALEGPASCQPSIQVELLAVGVLLNLIYQIAEVQLPTLNIVEVRKTVLDVQMAPIFKKFEEAFREKATATLLAKNFARVTIMVPRRSFRGLWIWKDFEFVYQGGFEEDHQDVDLLLYSWQGVAGEAIRLRKPVAQGSSRADKNPRGWWRFKWPWGMFKWQREQTAHVHWVLSVPMFKKSSGPGRRGTVVGVINIDVVDKNLATFLDNLTVDTDPVVGPIIESLLLAGYIGAALW